MRKYLLPAFALALLVASTLAALRSTSEDPPLVELTAQERAIYPGYDYHACVDRSGGRLKADCPPMDGEGGWQRY